MNLLNQRHEVLTVRLWDPREIELPDIGMVVMEDAETGDQMFVDTHDRKFRQRFEEAARQREAELAQAFKRAGVDALALSTEEDLVQAIVRFATLRRQTKKVALVFPMTFIWPAMLFSLVLVPLFIGVYLLMQRRRRQLTANYGSLGFAPGAKGRQPGLRRHIPVVFFLLGLTILAIALARPQAVVALPKQEGTVILAFDVSGSMAADDIKPTRMEAAKVAATRLRETPAALCADGRGRLQRYRIVRAGPDQ